jgi:hypothetical protein
MLEAMDSTRLEVKVKPNARRNALTVQEDGSWLAEITAPPVDGKANAALIALVAALKSSNHFRAGFEPLARAVITADPPGLTTHQVAVFPRQKATVPLWPLDPKASYTP